MEQYQSLQPIGRPGEAAIMSSPNPVTSSETIVRTSDSEGGALSQQKKAEHRKSGIDTRRARRRIRGIDSIARSRTSEFMMRILAGMAVRLAIKANRPAKQDVRVRVAELHYMQQLWSNYTKRELMLNN